MQILRYLAIKGNYVSTVILTKVGEINRFSQQVRQDFIDHIFEPDYEITEKIKLKTKIPRSRAPRYLRSVRFRQAALFHPEAELRGIPAARIKDNLGV